MNAWDKRENESAKSYQAFCDYRDMGTGRSLRALHKQYIQQVLSKQSARPPTKKENTLFQWSAKHEWQKRIEAWFNHLSSAQTQSREDAIQELLDEELSDSKMQLDKWHDAWKRLPLHESQHVDTKHHGDGNYTISQFIKLNYDDLARMTKWRDDIGKQHRRALGLPEKVTEKRIDEKTAEDKIIDDIRDGLISFDILVDYFDGDTEYVSTLFARAGRGTS